MEEYSKSKLNRVKGVKIRATYFFEKINTILLLSLFFIKMSISNSQDYTQSEEGVSSKKDTQKGLDFNLIITLKKK